ncbi:hypothetical protein V1527DRAFT_458912 [Lipomyces starkeyi]
MICALLQIFPAPTLLNITTAAPAISYTSAASVLPRDPNIGTLRDNLNKLPEPPSHNFYSRIQCTTPDHKIMVPIKPCRNCIEAIAARFRQIEA